MEENMNLEPLLDDWMEEEPRQETQNNSISREEIENSSSEPTPLVEPNSQEFSNQTNDPQSQNQPNSSRIRSSLEGLFQNNSTSLTMGLSQLPPEIQNFVMQLGLLNQLRRLHHQTESSSSNSNQTTNSTQESIDQVMQSNDSSSQNEIESTSNSTSTNHQSSTPQTNFNPMIPFSLIQLRIYLENEQSNESPSTDTTNPSNPSSTSEEIQTSSSPNENQTSSSPNENQTSSPNENQTSPDENQTSSTENPNPSTTTLETQNSSFPEVVIPPNSRRLILNIVIGNPLFVGSENDFDSLLNRLFQQHEANGPPPASKKIMDLLPTLIIEDQHLKKESRCSVCFDDFDIGGSAVLLPCAHFFHKNCVATWLEQHNTCPVCRYELPVDDLEYEEKRKKRMAHRQVNEESFFSSESIQK